MNNETKQILQNIIDYIPIIIILVQFPLIFLGLTKIFVVRKELIEQYRKERENLRQEVKKDVN